ncbi:MAG: discoidin domain-containing protein, partial [Tepidisphaeraceae bacterium]
AWLAVDLGKTFKISRVRIDWETAYSKAFAVQVSQDGKDWKDVFTEENGKGGVSEIKFTPVEARHVRIFCTKRGTQWGHAIRELGVFE